MTRGFFWRLWTWWNARLDRKRNLPSPEARAISDTERQIQTAANGGIRAAEQQYLKAVRPLEATLAKTSKSIRERLQPEWDRLVAKTGRREIDVKIAHWVHWFLLAVLTAGETAFNLVAFNVFREPGLHTFLMAAAVSVAIPLCAWSLGVWIRQWPAPAWVTATKIVLTAAALVAVLVGVNGIRMKYLQQLAPEFAGNSAGLQAAFFTVNVVVLIAAVLVTYFSHDPEKGFAESKLKLDRALRIESNLMGRIERLRSMLATDVEMIKEAGWQLMAYYRMVNRRRRERVPSYFDDDEDKNYRPQFVLPAAVDEPRPEPAVMLQALEGGRR